MTAKQKKPATAPAAANAKGRAAKAQPKAKAKPAPETDQFGFRVGTKRHEIGKMLLRKSGVTVAEIAASEIHTEGATTGQYQLLLGTLLKSGLATRERDGAAFRYYAAL